MDFSSPIKTVKEEDRGEREFRTFKAESCPSFFKNSNLIILSNLSSKIF